jgi:undecaprenyl-diphosphatase
VQKFGAAALALFVLLAVLVPASPLHLERTWMELMTDARTPLLTHVALACNWLGRGLGRGIVIAVPGVVLLVGRRWRAAAVFALVEALTPLATTIARVAVDRPRPPRGLVHAVGASFPSGHTSFAAATCFVLVLLFTSGGRRRVGWVLAAAAIVLMGWSRTYVEVHWLLDVLGGFLLGAGVALSTFAAASEGTLTSRLHRDR